MTTTAGTKHAPLVFVLRRLGARPELILGTVLTLILGFLVLTPLAEALHDAFTYQPYDLAYRRNAEVGSFTLFHFERIFTGQLSLALFYRPFLNSLIVGVGVTAIAIVVGTGLAWLMVRTDMPGRSVFGFLAVVPYMMPSWVLALAWLSLFRNSRYGGGDGMVTYFFDVEPANWFSYGLLPIVICLALHYYAYAFLLMGGAMESVDSELEEAGATSGIPKFKRLMLITVPLLLPALGSAIVMTFIRVLGTFGTPALLGLPVRFFTFSTQIYAALKSRNAGDGFVLALVLVVMAILFIQINSRIVGVRKSFVTLTGKGFRRRPVRLGAWRWPMVGLVTLFMLIVVAFPMLILVWESLMFRANDYSLGNLTLHYWIGGATESLQTGDPGIFNNPRIHEALWNSLKLGISASIVNGLLGLLVGYAIVRSRGSVMAKALEGISFAPYIFPSIALGAIYIGIFARSYGPLPALYGTFALLVLITVVKNLPFTARTGMAAMHQIDKSLEETARVQGIGWFRRMWQIILPMSRSGVVAGMLLTFISAMRELSLIVLLVTPTTMVLPGLIYGYQEQNQPQHSSAVSLLLVMIIFVVNGLVRLTTGQSFSSRKKPDADRAERAVAH